MRSTLFLSLFPSYPTRSTASKGFVLPGVLSEFGLVAAVFFSHPDETNIVAKIIATNIERRAVFISLGRKQFINWLVISVDLPLGNLPIFYDGTPCSRNTPSLLRRCMSA